MKRVLGLLVVLTGAFPLLFEAGITHAEMKYEVECRAELGIAENARLEAALLYTFRRCMLTKQVEELRMRDAERLQVRYDQQFWRRNEIGQEILKESRRSLKLRLESQEKLRKDFYRTSTVQERSEVLQQSRRVERTHTRILERAILEQERDLAQARRNAANTRCRTYKGFEKEHCIEETLELE